MFSNFKVTAHMRTPVAVINPIILDSILASAKLKEILGEEYYAGSNELGDREFIDNLLSPILDKKQGVYCTSIGIGDNREYIGSWTKRWNAHDDDLVRFGGRRKRRVNIGSGFYKNYHMPIVLKSYKTITFYVRGDMEEIERLLNNYIFYLGKKSSQGYGQIRKWEFVETGENWSIWKDGEPMRPIPVSKCEGYIEEIMRRNQPAYTRQHPTIPPYWRNDNIELCVMPREVTP